MFERFCSSFVGLAKEDDSLIIFRGGGTPNDQQICWLAANDRKGISSRGPTTPAALQVVFLDKG